MKSAFRNLFLGGTLSLFLLIAVGLKGFSEEASSLERAVGSLETRIFEKQYAGQALNTRLARLELALHQPVLSKASTPYRLERLYAVQDGQLTKQAMTLSIQAYNRGVDATHQGHYDQAVECYQQAIQINPRLMQAYNNLGSLLEHLQRYGEAIQLYEKAVKQAPEKASEPVALLHRNLGILYEKVGNIEQSLTEYQRYLKLSPTPDPTISEIVAQYVAERRKGQSAPDYAASIQRQSEGKTLLWSRQLNPIPVYIALDEDQVPFLPAIQEALSLWEKGSQGRIRFKEVGAPAAARIIIKLQEGPLSHPYMEVGHASYDVSTDPETQRKLNLKVDITVNTGERNIPIPLPERLSQVKRLALHELGHAIGIWGHSPDPGDIMYSRPIASALSSRDVQTLQKLYQAEDHHLSFRALP